MRSSPFFDDFGYVRCPGRRGNSSPRRTAGGSGLLPIVEATVAQVYMVAPQALRGPSRGLAHVALARQVAMYLAHVVFGLRLSEVGRGFGRDRTTVAHACLVVEDRRDNPTFDRTLELLVGILYRQRDLAFPEAVEPAG